MQRTEQIKKQKQAEKEKIRAIITGASNKNTSDKGSPSARSEQ